MRKHLKPIVVVSRCLEFSSCRYDGGIVQSEIVRLLKDHVTFIKVCPEIEIGMETPRDPIRIIEKKNKQLLVQPTTGIDFTQKMASFSAEYLNKLDKVDGFILKSKSPSCGISDTKLFPSAEKSMVIGKTSGLFGREVKLRFPYLAVEDEMRLTNYRIREHFLIKLFTLADFRSASSRDSINSLIKFHSKNKYLFMAYNQTILKQMGQVLANHNDDSIKNIVEKYQNLLNKLLEKLPRPSSAVNAVEHIFGYFKNQLQPSEKRFFLSLIKNYKNKKISLSNLTVLLNSWSIKYETEYILDQTIFAPYPIELTLIDDTGRGRDLK